VSAWRGRALAGGMAALLCSSGAWAAKAAAGARQLSLEQAVDLAIQNNPRMKAARLNTAAQEDQARSSRGHLLPTVALSGTYVNVNSPEDLNVGELLGPYLSSGSGMGSGSGPNLPSEIPLKGFWSAFGTVAVAQPLTGLLHISQDYASAEDQAGASREDLHAQEADIRQQVENGLLTLFEARALIGIARASRVQLQDQLQLTEA
jgi:outer membrane protein TolC